MTKIFSGKELSVFSIPKMYYMWQQRLKRSIKRLLSRLLNEADVVNRQEVKGTTDIVFIVDKSGSMDSHITDVANNIAKICA